MPVGMNAEDADSVAEGVLRIDRAIRPLRGTVHVGGDKSITHRALFLAALNRGSTTIVGGSSGGDSLATLGLLRTIGCEIEIAGDTVRVAPTTRDASNRGRITVDCANSGTTARLAAGMLTGEFGEFELVGDLTLSRRPMDRVVHPLRRLGASLAANDGKLPLLVRGSGAIAGSCDPIEAASAQVHASLILAALRSRRGAVLQRVSPMRDHTLRTLALFRGVPFEPSSGFDEIAPLDLDRDVVVAVPGDPSSASFLVAAALLVDRSELIIEGVSLNPTRTAFFEALTAMGADIELDRVGEEIEPRGRIRVRTAGELRAIELSTEENDQTLPSLTEMLDEVPLLALLASQAHGTTTLRGLRELRVKESDRIQGTVSVLASLGIVAKQLEEGISVTGPQAIRGGGIVRHHGDHRLALCAAVAALAASRAVMIPDAAVASVSFPEFWRLIDTLAPGSITPVSEDRDA